MKILFLSPILPVPPIGGGRLRVYNLLKELSKENEVTSVCFGQDEPEEGAAELKNLGVHAVHYLNLPPPRARPRGHDLRQRLPYGVRAYWSAEMYSLLRRLLSDRQYDIVHVEEAVMAQYLEKIEADGPVILGRQKVDSWFHKQLLTTFENNQPLRRRLYSFAEWLKWSAYDRHLAHSFSFQVTVTDFDRQLLRRFNQNLAVSLVPNGVDIDYFEFRPPPEPGSPSIVFVGSMNYQPNIDGMRFFMDDIYPHLKKQNPELKTYVVGRDPTPEVKQMADLDNLIVTGAVEDIRPYLYQSTLSICPIRIGGGTRLKILESMAAGRPVVSTSTGADGLPCDHGANILISDRPEEFAGHITALIADADLCQRLATNGRRLVEDHFHWATISEKLVEAYEQAIGEYNIASRED